MTIGQMGHVTRVTCPLIGQSIYRTLAAAASTLLKGYSSSARGWLVGFYTYRLSVNLLVAQLRPRTRGPVREEQRIHDLEIYPVSPQAVTP